MIIYPNPHSNDYFGTENIDNLADSGRAEDDRHLRGLPPRHDVLVELDDPIHCHQARLLALD